MENGDDTSAPTPTAYELPAGGVMGITNSRDEGLVVRIRLACGAVVECELAPGSRIQITGGTAHINLDLLDGSPAGLSLVDLRRKHE